MVRAMNLSTDSHTFELRARVIRPWMITIGAAAGALLAIQLTPSASPAIWISLGGGLLGGLLVPRPNRRPSTIEPDSESEFIPAALNGRPELRSFLLSLRHSLTEFAEHSDELLQEAAILKLVSAQEDLDNLAAGRVVYAATEAWRAAYERVLRSPGISRYLSVAWIRNDLYWRDVPGKHSMQLNFDLVELGVRIERILILNDFFWPVAALLPAKTICQWVDEQHKRGIVVRLMRESEIEHERELLTDFGIYGQRAAGRLELDDDCRTSRFTLDFAQQSIRCYEDQWRRLLLFSTPYQELLDRRVGRG